MLGAQSSVAASSVRLATLLALLAVQSVAAWAESTVARYRLDQPSMPLPEALRSIARQTNISVLFDPSVVSKLVSRPVSGEFSAVEAMSRALEGTGLTAEQMKDGSIVVRPSAAMTSDRGAASRAGEHQGPAATAASSPGLGALPIQLAQAQGPAQGATDTAAREPAPVREEERRLEKIEITGSRIKRVESEAALPVNVYTREDIERSGQPTMTGFLGTLNEVSTRGSEGAVGASRSLGTIQLRGLPIGSTLVLINGRRVQAIGVANDPSVNVFDLNLIPVSAVERIEVLPVGSSAVYGGDALGGVVNIILRRSADGIGVDSAYGYAKGTNDTNVSVSAGGQFERGTFVLIGTYGKTNPLHAGERSFFVDADYRRFGGPDARTRGCTPGTVSSDTGANLPGLNTPIAGIPSGIADRPLTPADFASTAGLPNLCNDFAIGGKGDTLIDGREMAALYGTAEYRVKAGLAAFGEVARVESRSTGAQNGLLLDDVLVPASNPFNPFGVPVRVTGRLGLVNGSADGFDQSVKYTRGVAGLRGDLVVGWDFEIALLRSQDDSRRLFRNDTIDFDALDSALSASSQAAALNPFTSGRAASDEVLRSIWFDTLITGQGEKTVGTAFARGPAFLLPAGPVDVIAGGESGRDRWTNANRNTGSSQDAKRDSDAIFAESRAPLLSRADARGMSELATLTLAGRRDSYSDFGAAETHQVGFELRPARSALIRAATATSFKPPTLVQVAAAPFSIPTEIFRLVDPARGNEPIVGGRVVGGPNPNLKPERGRAEVFGVVWEPESAAGLRFSVSAWQIEIKDLIVFLSPRSVLRNEALFPGLVTRGPSTGNVPGPVTEVAFKHVNFGRLEVAGTDLEVAYALRTTLGRWRVSGSATRTNKYDVTLQPGAPTEDRLGTRSFEAWAPEWKGRGSVQFDRGAWSLGATARYLGQYTDVSPSTRKLGGTWTVDLTASADLRKVAPLMMRDIKRATLSASVTNIADRLPEFAGDSFPFYDTTQADWRGRYISVRLSIGW